MFLPLHLESLTHHNHFFFQMEVMEIALSQRGPASERQLAIIDKNRDFYLTPIKHIGPALKLVKLGKQPSCWLSTHCVKICMWVSY